MLRQQPAKFILKRHWLEAEILPYVLRCVGVAPLLDPALVATIAATGLYFREGHTLEDLINTNMCPPGCNLRQRSVVRDLLTLWVPFVKMDTMYSALSNSGGGLKGCLSRLKRAIFQGMTLAARVRLRRKVVEEGWSRGVSLHWLELTSSLKKKGATALQDMLFCVGQLTKMMPRHSPSTEVRPLQFKRRHLSLWTYDATYV